MNKFLQIVCYTVSFVFVLWIGNVFEGLTRDEVLYMSISMPGHPVDLFMKNHFIITYLFLFPWLGFIGLPAFAPIRTPYWDANLFLLRFSVFFSIEIFLLCYFSINCFLPLVGMLNGMGENPPPDVWLEITVVGLFWLSVLLLLIAFFVRIGRNRGSKK
jgi:hypothetical protein